MAAELLDAKELARLGDLKLRARIVVEGALAGLHRSPHHGASVEFAEHKEYTPGDEVRRIDWKAYGKFDKYYVKRFEEETELRGYLCVDCSASMGYAGEGVSKLAYASLLAASLAYLLLSQQDQAGLVAFADTIRAYLPPRARAGQLGDLETALTKLTASGTTDLVRAVSYVSDVARPRSLIVIMSDMLSSGAETVALLRGLRARQHDVVLLHILDGDELRMPPARFDGPARFVDPEAEADELLADPRFARASYLESIGAFIAGLRSACAEGGVEYHVADTARPPSETLLELLRGRVRAKPMSARR